METSKLQEMIDKKREEARKKHEERFAKKEAGLAKQKEESAKKIEEMQIDTEKLAQAAQLEEEIKERQEALRALGIKKGIGVARGPRPMSVSGQYKSVREYAEKAFADTEGKITAAEMEAGVKAEFPESRFTKSDYNWLKNKIISLGEWTKVEVPTWYKTR